MLKNIVFDSLSDKKIALLLLIYVANLLLYCSHMSPLYYSNEWSDVNVYFTIGKAMFNGITPYAEIFDHKGPLIFIIYGIGYLISNDSFFGMFLIQIAGWLAMTYSIYKTSNFYLGKAGACIVSMILPVLLIKVMKAGGAAEEFILFFECISFYFFIKYYQNKDASAHSIAVMFLHGVLCSMVFFIKMNLMLIWFFPLAGIYINLLLKKEYKNFALNLLAYIGGFLIIAAPICIYFYMNGALDDAYYVYFELNKKYAGILGIKESLILLLYHSFYIYLEPLSMCLLLIIGVFYFPIKFIENKIGKWVLLLAGATGAILTYISPVYQYYYPIPLLLFSTWGVLSIFLFINRYVKSGQLSLKFVVIISIILVYTGLAQKDLSETRMAGLLVNNPGVLMQKFQKIIDQEENPTLVNLSFGLGNSLFTTCNILPNVKYFVAPNLTYDSYPDLRDEQEKYIKNKEVQFAIMKVPLDQKHSSAISKERIVNNYKFFDNLPALKENYTIVAKDTIVNTIDERSIDIYTLYKRND